MGGPFVWEIVAGALFTVCLSLLGVIWSRVSADMVKVADRLAEVAQVVHGHGIRLDMIDGRGDG